MLLLLFLLALGVSHDDVDAAVADALLRFHHNRRRQHFW